jgi:hypothetical protein
LSGGGGGKRRRKGNATTVGRVFVISVVRIVSDLIAEKKVGGA